MRSRRFIFAGLGWLSVALAFAGALLPGLPMTVFLLTASYCFSRSYPRFDAWLRANRFLGPSLRRFREQGGMTRAVKNAATTSMWTAICFSSLALVSLNPALPVLLAALGAIGTLTIQFGVRTVTAVAAARTRV